MKSTTLLALGLLTCLAFTATPVLAQEKKSAPAANDGGHSHFTKIPATVPEIWKKIHQQQAELIKTVAKKDLGEAHDHAFAIRDLVKALPAKVAAEHKPNAEAGVKEIRKLAADIDKSGAAGAQKATEANVKKMGEAILALQTKLQPPEVIIPVAVETAREAVPLKPELQKQVDDQVLRFIDALATEDVTSDAFKSRLDSAFALGKEEISTASSLMQGRFMQRNFAGIEDSAAFKAIGEIRGQLDELNPGNEGDLMQPRKLLGLIPYGNKLEAYFRKYQSAADQLKTSMGQLYAARDDMQKDVIDIEATRSKPSSALHSSSTRVCRLAGMRLSGLYSVSRRTPWSARSIASRASPSSLNCSASHSGALVDGKPSHKPPMTKPAI